MNTFYLPVLSFFIFYTSVTLPVFGVFIALFSPVPMMFYLDHPKRDKIGDMIFAALMFAAIIYQPVTGFYFLLSVVAFAILNKRVNRIKENAYWIPIVFGPAAIFIMLFVSFYLIEPVRVAFVEIVKANISKVIELSEQNGINPVYADYFLFVKAHMDEVSTMFVYLLPGLNYAFLTMMCFISQKIYFMKTNGPKYIYRLPDNFVWGLIAFGFFVMARNNVILYTIALNAVIVYSAIYFYQGVGIINHWTTKINMLPFFRVFIFILIVMEPPVAIIVALMGLFSIWVNFYGKSTDELS